MSRIAIRVDSSARIGSGHVTRCLALAQELDTLGSMPYFICRDHTGGLCDDVQRGGYVVSRLDPTFATAGGPGSCAATSGTDWRTDARDTLSALPSPVDWLVVDHYALGAEWERQLRQQASKILVVDDLANRPHDCDLLVDPNDDSHARYRDLVPKDCRKLLGPAFALLRQAFAAQRRRLRPRVGDVKRLLLFFGSADSMNQTPRILRLLRRSDFAELAIDVVVGRANRNADSVRELCEAMPNMRYHVQVDNMAELMAAADLAIGAGGSATWERCCLGLPTLIEVCAENQRVPAETAARYDAAICLGPVDRVSDDLIVRALLEVMRDPDRCAGLSEAGMGLVDGLGARRVAEAVLGFQLVDAGPDDVEQIWRWANDPTVRVHSFNPRPISFPAHQRWYDARLRDPDCKIYIARLGNRPLGQIRFEIENTRAIIDVSVATEWRGRRIGSRILKAGLERFRIQRRAFTAYALVKSENVESLALFTAAGFVQRQSTRPGVIEFELGLDDSSSPRAYGS